MLMNLKRESKISHVKQQSGIKVLHSFFIGVKSMSEELMG